MIRVLTILLAMALPLEAAASCYADYKAKRSSPLRLHYGVMELPDRACGDAASARREIERRLARHDWQLLSVEGIFDESGLASRRASAGEFFLRY